MARHLEVLPSVPLTGMDGVPALTATLDIPQLQVHDETAADFTDEQIAEFREAFLLFDKDGDGRISAPEVGQVMHSLGIMAELQEIEEMVEEIDTDGNGTIEFDEFLELMARKRKDTDEVSELREAFRVLDRDQDGYLSAEELRYFMTCMGEKLTHDEVTEMLSEAGVKEGGYIHFEQFLRVVSCDSPQ